MKFEMDITTEDELDACERLVRVGVSLMRSAGNYDEALTAPLIVPLREARQYLNQLTRAERQSALDLVDPLETIKRSPYYSFWNTGLVPDRAVRCTLHPNAVYEVVSGERVESPPDERYRGAAAVRNRGKGLWIELRRQSTKTFWCHVAQVRPLSWTPEDDQSLK